MLQASDVMAAKIAVQLRLVGDDDAREVLRDQGRDPRGGDFVNRVAARYSLDPRAVEVVRHRAALYEHVRGEAVYLRLLERERSIPRATVASLLAQLEAQPQRRRLGEVLVRHGKLTREQDADLLARARESVGKDDARILDRYQQEDFAGVSKPLIRGSNLDPGDFRISVLFRSKETQALVDQIDLQALREEARRAAAERGRGMDVPTPVAPATTAAERTYEERPGLPTPTQVPKKRPAAAAAPAAAEGEGEGSGQTSDQAQEGAAEQGARFTGMEAVSKLTRIADYTIVEVLGVGGMGAVFLGQKDGRGEYCAIKVMLNQAAGETEMGRFRREISLTRRVQHPNVISILDSGETPHGLTYFVVPALAGKELRALIDASEGKGLEPRLVVKIYKQVLEGMEAVHQQRIVHRDLKPENVFIRAGGDEEVKIMDFGLAKLEDGAEAQEDCFRSGVGEVVGSPAYIAPESITNDAIDRRTDIYSLGVILFEMLTGRLPLESETAQGFLGQHLICPPLTLAEAQPDRGWPPQLEDLLARMLAKSREERPASCGEVLGAFKQVAVPLLRVDAPPTAVVAVPAPIEVAAAQAAQAQAAQAAQAKHAEKPFAFKGLLGRLLGK
jgi:hypothetical protein